MSRKLYGVLAGMMLTGCATSALSPAGAKVVTAPNVNVQGCKYLGVVVGQGGGAFGGAWVSNDQLMRFAMNDAQNKAAALGATHLQTTAPQLGGYEGTTTTATVTGSAFRCSADATAVAGAQPIASPMAPVDPLPASKQAAPVAEQPTPAAQPATIWPPSAAAQPATATDSAR